MDFLGVLSLFFLFGCVFCEENSLIPCAVDDIACLNKSLETLLEKTATGIPLYDIKPLDPLFMPIVSVQAMENVMLHFNNITIIGLKYMTVHYFKMDPTAKTVQLSVKVENLNITAAPLVVELTDKSKNFTGPLTVKTTVIVTARYVYSLKMDDKGVEHFEVGPETITCEALAEPEVTLSEDLDHALLNDPDVQSIKDEYNSHREEQRKAAVCKIIQKAIVDVVNNLSTVA